MVGYFRNFIKTYGLIVAPLTTLLKKDALCWSGEASVAFEALKQATISPLLLALPNFKRLFIIKCDTFGLRVAVVLMQWGKPLAYLLYMKKR